MEALDGQRLDKLVMVVNLEGLLFGVYLDDDGPSLMLATEIVGLLVNPDGTGCIDLSAVSLPIDLV